MKKMYLIISLMFLIAVIYLITNNQNNINYSNKLIINKINNMELKKEILKEGSGEKTVEKGDAVVVHYTGTFEDGAKFDSSLDRSAPFGFTVGVGQVIQGWDQGLIGMKIGEKAKLIIPPDMAYGPGGIPGAIPPNSTLIFEIELLEIK